MACTVWPAATNARHSLRPTNPDEPATRSFTAGIPSVKWPRSAAYRCTVGMVGSQLSVTVRVGRSAPFLDPVLGPSHLVGRRQAGDLRRRDAVTGVGAFGLGELSRGAQVGGIGEYRRERHPLLFVVAVMAFLLVRVLTGKPPVKRP